MKKKNNSLYEVHGAIAIMMRKRLLICKFYVNIFSIITKRKKEQSKVRKKKEKKVVERTKH